MGMRSNSFALATATLAAVTATAQGAPPSNQYICMFDDSVSADDVAVQTAKAVNPELGQVIGTYDDVIQGFVVRLPAIPSSKSPLARLSQHNPAVSICVKDGISRAASQGRPPGAGGGGGKPDKGDGGDGGTSLPWGVERVGGSGDGTGKTAWILDSGVDLDHPSLNVDTGRDRDFIDGDEVADDGYGHGTHIAGTIGAIASSNGVVGIAEGATIVPVRVLNNFGFGPDSGVIDGLNYIYQLAQAGDVVNISLVADAPNEVMDQAVRELAAKGVIVTIAAGNSKADAGNYSPQRVEAANVYTVSAFGSRDRFSRYSNYGAVIDYAEPGDDIFSLDLNGATSTRSGTSFAAPHLAGILLLQDSPNNGGTVNRDPDGNPDIIGVR